MEVWAYILIFGILIAIAIIFLTVAAVIVDKAMFGERQDKKEGVKYFMPEDYNLNVESLPVYYDGEQLNSGIYTAEKLQDCKRLVIFQHGFGAGVSSYMTEIAYFARKGCAVVATDAYGCNLSPGKKIKGFYAGAEAVIATYIAVKKDERLKDMLVFLVGHSWGAYSVACASAKIKADGVVAMSGFNAPAQCICDSLKGLSKYGRLMAPILHPWLYLVNFFKFGCKGNAHAAKRIKKSGVKCLLIQGEKDLTVPVAHSLAVKADGGNVKSVLLADKKHNPYATVRAEEQLKKLMSFNGNQEQWASFLSGFDWNLATEEDEEIMTLTTDFICA